MMKITISLLCLLFSFSMLNAQILSASHTGLDLTLEILVDVPENEVEITMTGPADSWFAYGFGNNFMNGTYAFLVESPNGGEIFEMKLGNRAIGDTLANSMDNFSITDSGNNTRTVQITRPRVGASSDYFTFPEDIANISFIYANANGPTMGYHGFGNKELGTQNSMSGLQFSSVVPVTWSAFVLKDRGGKTNINWKTESEVNNSGFYVQRSLDARSWADLGFVEAKSEGGASYQYLDERSQPGVNYYRIKQVDNDGSENFSVIKSIEIRGNMPYGDIVLFPNPVQDVLNLRFEGEMEKGLKRIQIIDMQMKTLIDEVWEDEEANRINVGDLPAGHYLITVKHKDWGYSGYFIKP